MNQNFSMAEQTPSGGNFAKVLIVLCVMAGMGIAVIGAAGTLVYLNRDKVFGLLGNNRKEEPKSAPSSSSPGNPASVTPATRALADKLGAARSAAAPSSGTGRPVVASTPIHANDRSYASYTKRDDVLVLVDYYADWCGPCRGIAPHLSRLAANHGDKVVVLKVNVDREKALASRAGVRSIPDVRLLHAGNQLEQSIGGHPYQYYESLVLKHAARLPRPSAAPPRPSDRSPSAPSSPKGSITPFSKDWLPPGVQPAKPKRVPRAPTT